MSQPSRNLSQATRYTQLGTHQRTNTPMWAPTANHNTTRTFITGMDQRGIAPKQQLKTLGRHQNRVLVQDKSNTTHENHIYTPNTTASSRQNNNSAIKLNSFTRSYSRTALIKRGPEARAKSLPNIVHKKYESSFSTQMQQGSGATVMERRRARLNAALCVSAEAGEVQVVDALMHDPRIDPNFDGCSVLRSAAKGGRVAVISLLLRDARIDPSASSNAAIRAACFHGHLGAAKRLLQDKRVDPSVNGQYCIGVAAEMGHYEVVELLLRHPKIDPSADNNYAFHLASQNGHKLIAQILLDDGRVGDGTMEQER